MLRFSYQPLNPQAYEKIIVIGSLYSDGLRLFTIRSFDGTWPDSVFNQIGSAGGGFVANQCRRRYGASPCQSESCVYKHIYITVHNINIDFGGGSGTTYGSATLITMLGYSGNAYSEVLNGSATSHSYVDVNSLKISPDVPDQYHIEWTVTGLPYEDPDPPFPINPGGGGGDGAARPLVHRQTFAGEHGFIYGALALDYLAIHWDALPGTH